MFLFKFFLYFTLSFFILSIPVYEKTVFHHIFEVTAPYTNQVFSSIKNGTLKGLNKGKQIGTDIFFKKNSNQDSIDSSYSAPKRKIKPVEKFVEPQDDYTNEEKEFLRRILKKAP